MVLDVKFRASCMLNCMHHYQPLGVQVSVHVFFLQIHIYACVISMKVLQWWRYFLSCGSFILFVVVCFLLLVTQLLKMGKLQRKKFWLMLLVQAEASVCGADLLVGRILRWPRVSYWNKQGLWVCLLLFVSCKTVRIQSQGSVLVVFSNPVTSQRSHLWTCWWN